MNTRLLRRLHRWIALGFSLVVFASAGSGVIHIVMARTQAPPPKAGASGGEAAVFDPGAWKLSPADAVKASQVAGVTGINLRIIGGEPWYVIRGKGKMAYVNGADGRIGADEDALFAREIAARFLHCDRDEARQTAYLTAYTTEYINIFRLLPVYRFDRDDGKGTRVYVSTATESVTRATDDGKQFEANLFANVHKLMFLPNRDARDGALLFLMGGLLLASALGIALFFVTRSRKE